MRLKDVSMKYLIDDPHVLIPWCDTPCVIVKTKNKRKL
jgi:hypothetical protein